MKARRRSWQNREVTLEAQAWSLLPDLGSGPAPAAEEHELLRALEDGIRTTLTAHQRNVLGALAVTGVPSDVLAERLGTTRGSAVQDPARRPSQAARTFDQTGPRGSWPRAT